jgi:transposase-like protein
MAAMARPDKLGGEGKAVQIDEVLLRYITSTAGEPNDAVIVFGLASEGQVLSAIVPDRRSGTLIPHIVARVIPGSKVVTDMLPGYRTLGKYGFDHVQINHSVAFHDFRGHTNNDIEAYWSTVRRMLRSARQVSRAHMWTFLAEIEFKYNRRHNKGAIFEELISNFPNLDIKSRRDLERKFDWSI